MVLPSGRSFLARAWERSTRSRGLLSTVFAPARTGISGQPTMVLPSGRSLLARAWGRNIRSQERLPIVSAPPGGNIWVGDQNNAVWKVITATGVGTKYTLTGAAPFGIADPEVVPEFQPRSGSLMARQLRCYRPQSIQTALPPPCRSTTKPPAVMGAQRAQSPCPQAGPRVTVQIPVTGLTLGNTYHYQWRSH